MNNEVSQDTLDKWIAECPADEPSRAEQCKLLTKASQHIEGVRVNCFHETFDSFIFTSPDGETSIALSREFILRVAARAALREPRSRELQEILSGVPFEKRTSEFAREMEFWLRAGEPIVIPETSE